MSNREIRQLMRGTRVSNGWQNQGPGGLTTQFQTQLRPVGDTLRVNDNRLNRFNGQSVLLNDNGVARSIARGLELDLTSSNKSIILGSNLFSSAQTYSINVGGEVRTLSSGDKVSAAEYVALQQVRNGGSQALTVDQSGRGTAGQFNLNSISDGGRTIRAAELVIPEHVTASGDFSRSADGVRLTNDLVNYGSISAYSSSRNVDTARIAARDINNNAGASISTGAETLNLSLRAERDLNNAGSISSSGSLELSAGRSINNHGSVSSSGSITLTGNPESDLAVNNVGGTFSALNGAINVRPSDYTGLGNTTVYGGDFLSREFNLFSGQGTTDVTVNKLTGVVNSSGTAVHVSAHTDTLVIGEQCLVGDPTYYNVGDIQLNGDIVVAEDLAIIASGDITRTANNTKIAATNVDGSGADITIIAGANVTAGSGTSGPTIPPGTIATSPVSFTGASASGGNVDLFGTPFTIDASASGLDKSGGNVTIAAYADSNSNKGLVNIANGSLIATYGVGAATNGGVTIVGGGVGSTINLGAQILAHAGTGSTGDITIATAQPAFSSGSTMTFGTNGAITTGNTIVPSTMINAGSITLGGSSSITATSGNISIHAGSGVNIGSFIFSKAAVGADNQAGGNITIVSDAGPVVTSNLLSATGGNNAAGGNVTVTANDSAQQLQVVGATANGGTAGGTVSISNTGLGGVSVSGFITASSNTGDGGDVSVSTPGKITTNVVQFGADSDNTKAGGTITLNGSQISIENGSAVIAISGAPSSVINLTTTAGGITTSGNDLMIATGGAINLDLANNTINADSPGGKGGTLTLSAGTISNANSSILTPLIISANGANAGSGGKILYTDRSTVQTFVGAPLKAPKGLANFLSLSAHAGLNDGDGGQVFMDVGGNLTVDPAMLNVALSPSAGPHNGGTVSLFAGGSVPSTKIGKLVITNDLNVDGANGGAGGTIQLRSMYSKDFLVGATKLPKNGIFGGLSAAGGALTVASGGGVKLLASDAISGSDVTLQASGKGKISAAKGVTFTAPTANLVSNSGSIVLNTAINDLTLTTNSSAKLNNVNGVGGLLRLHGISAARGFDLHTDARLSNSSSTITVGTKGDIKLVNDAGFISMNSGAQMSAVNGSITVQSNDLVNGSIRFAAFANATTSGDRAGDIIIAIGAIPKKPVISAAPSADFNVVTTGKGLVTFGVNSALVTSDGGTVNLTANNKKIILNNASTNGQNISFYGSNFNSITAGQ